MLAMLLVLLAPCGLGDAGKLARADGDGEIWVEVVSKDEWSVGLVNRGEKTISLDVIWTEIGLPVRVRTKRGVVHGGFAEKLAPGACSLYRVKR